MALVGTALAEQILLVLFLSRLTLSPDFRGKKCALKDPPGKSLAKIFQIFWCSQAKLWDLSFNMALIARYRETISAIPACLATWVLEVSRQGSTCDITPPPSESEIPPWTRCPAILVRDAGIPMIPHEMREHARPPLQHSLEQGYAVGKHLCKYLKLNCEGVYHGTSQLSAERKRPD